MKIFRFEGLLQDKEWISPAFVKVDNKGKLISITSECTENFEEVSGLAVPAFPNAHSHSFQYAMAGLAEVHPAGSEPDDFWSWREAMYNLALSVNPDEFENIATMLYSEMIRHGYNSVAEFHYVHHDKNGEQYSNLAELGSRLVNAAKNSGIKLTLIPIFYQKGGFGVKPVDKQKRFISPTSEDYIKLFEASQKACSEYDDANIAVGIHSMRGVQDQDIVNISKWADPNIAFHIHISEQLKEIEDSIAYLGCRPVEWLLENIDLNRKYQLVHATHLTNEETIGIAKSEAQVVICPTTEGNLGDGIFPLKKFQENGGKWCLGTDSHVNINPLEELRLLDYGQRLISHKRNTFFSKEEGNSGFYAIKHAISNGRIAVNDLQENFFTLGSDFDCIVYDMNHPLLATTSSKYWMSSIIYSSDQNMCSGTILKGNWIVKNQKHFNQEVIFENFINTLNNLKSRA